MKTFRNAIRMRTAFAGIFAASLCGTASAAPFIVTDADFDAGTYDLRYLVGTNQLVQNGVVTTLDSTPLGELFLTNAGNSAVPAWEFRGSGPSVNYLQAPSGFGTSAAATMGFDLSAVTGQIASVELIASHNLFQFPNHNLTALGDMIFGDVATPGVFGAGPYSNIYTHTSDNEDGLGPGSLGTNGFVDITSLLSGVWLSNPDLLELRFGYELIDTDIPRLHLQLFRDGTFGSDDSFALRVTLVPEPGVQSLLVCTGMLLIAARRRLASPGRVDTPEA